MQLYSFTLTAEDGGPAHHFVAAPTLRAARDYAQARAVDRRRRLTEVQPVQALSGVPGTDGQTHTFPVFALEALTGLLTDAIQTLENADAFLAKGAGVPALFGDEVLRLRGTLSAVAGPEPFAVRTGFQAWSQTPARARSPEVDYGCWWVLKHPRDWPKWRVSLIVDTREVYAVALDGQQPDRFIVLGRVPDGEDPRAAMERLMDGWAEGALRLPELFGRFWPEAEPPGAPGAGDAQPVPL